MTDDKGNPRLTITIGDRTVFDHNVKQCEYTVYTPLPDSTDEIGPSFTLSATINRDS